MSDTSRNDPPYAPLGTVHLIDTSLHNIVRDLQKQVWELQEANRDNNLEHSRLEERVDVLLESQVNFCNESKASQLVLDNSHEKDIRAIENQLCKLQCIQLDMAKDQIVVIAAIQKTFRCAMVCSIVVVCLFVLALLAPLLLPLLTESAK